MYNVLSSNYINGLFLNHNFRDCVSECLPIGFVYVLNNDCITTIIIAVK